MNWQELYEQLVLVALFYWVLLPIVTERMLDMMARVREGDGREPSRVNYWEVTARFAVLLAAMGLLPPPWNTPLGLGATFTLLRSPDIVDLYFPLGITLWFFVGYFAPEVSSHSTPSSGAVAGV